jgi:hypothetical protein
MSWTQDVVAVLAVGKTTQLPFNAAWTNAVQQHPPRLRELGVRGAGDSLFDQKEANTLEWFRTVCQAAYEDRPAPDGRVSRLRGLRAALEPLNGDDLLPRRHAA